MIAVVPRKLPTVDNVLSSTSTNPVQNRVIKNEIDSINQRIGNVENPAQVWSDISFTINEGDWTLDSSSNSYKMTITSSAIGATSGVFVFYDESLENATSPVTAEETTGQVTFITGSVPDGTITGTIRIVDSVNGIVPLSRGGTGVAAENSADLLAQLGAASASDVADLQTVLGQCAFDLQEDESGELYLHCYTATNDEDIPFVVTENNGEYSLVFRHDV